MKMNTSVNFSGCCAEALRYRPHRRLTQNAVAGLNVCRALGRANARASSQCQPLLRDASR